MSIPPPETHLSVYPRHTNYLPFKLFFTHMIWCNSSPHVVLTACLLYGIVVMEGCFPRGVPLGIHRASEVFIRELSYCSIYSRLRASPQSVPASRAAGRKWRTFSAPNHSSLKCPCAWEWITQRPDSGGVYLLARQWVNCDLTNPCISAKKGIIETVGTRRPHWPFSGFLKQETFPPSRGSSWVMKRMKVRPYQDNVSHPQRLTLHANPGKLRPSRSLSQWATLSLASCTCSTHKSACSVNPDYKWLTWTAALGL